MKRSLFGTVGAAVGLLVMAQPAHAGTLPIGGSGLPCTAIISNAGEVCFKFDGGGAYGAPESFGATGQILDPASAISGPFAIFCVDIADDAPPVGATYLANITPLFGTPQPPAGFGDGSNPPNDFGVNDWKLYDEAVGLVEQWQALPAASQNADEQDYQWAIWQITNPTFPGGCGVPQTFSPCTDPLEQSLVTEAQGWSNTTLVADANNGDWEIVTDAGKSCNSGATECQEFIYETAPPSQVTPEPATMSLLALGLAGMAGAGFRRRKRR